VLAAEIGVQSLTVATVGLGGHVHGRASFAHRPDRFGPAETVADIVELSRPLLRSIDAERLVGVAVGVPGMVRAEDGFVHVAPNLGWRDVPLGTQLADACRSELGVTSSVLVRNESDLGALAEHLRTRSDVRDLVYVLGEVGIGTGVIANGRLLTGKAGYAGALGHLPVNPQGLVCGCGATGCWETEAGTGALLRHAGYAPDDSREAVEDVLARAALGDEVAVAAVDAVAYWLGVGLAAIVNVFNPERIVLDGIFAEIHPLAADRIETELASRALGPPRDVVEVVPSSLGADATLLGAAEVAFAPLLRNSAELTPVRRRPRPAARGTAAA
jgi:predicted NBD/HSP70 family sugar kinase